MPITLTQRCQFKLESDSDEGIMNLSGTTVSFNGKEDLEKTVILLNNHPEITELELEDCNLHDHHIILLAQQLKHVTSINLRGNSITTNGLQLFLEALQENKELSIKGIDLRNSNFSANSEVWDKIITIIPESLVRLNLDGNRAILGEIKAKVAAKIQENIKKFQASARVDSFVASSTTTLFKPIPVALESQIKKESSESQASSSTDTIIGDVHQKWSEFIAIFKQLPPDQRLEQLKEIQQQIDNLRSLNSISPSLIKSR